jgi:hypothetical protein
MTINERYTLNRRRRNVKKFIIDNLSRNDRYVYKVYFSFKAERPNIDSFLKYITRKGYLYCLAPSYKSLRKTLKGVIVTKKPINALPDLYGEVNLQIISKGFLNDEQQIKNIAQELCDDEPTGAKMKLLKIRTDFKQ